MESLTKYSLIGPCGMNCGICMAYLREKNKCPGCRGASVDKPVTRVRCKIKTCNIFQNDSAKFCFECSDFPCERVKHLDKRYRTKYNMSMIENLEYIRDYGFRKFIKNEDVKWTCSQCEGTICVHKGYCIDCGKKKERG
jgi:hypothetical protein